MRKLISIPLAIVAIPVLGVGLIFVLAASLLGALAAWVDGD